MILIRHLMYSNAKCYKGHIKGSHYNIIYDFCYKFGHMFDAVT